MLMLFLLVPTNKVVGTISQYETYNRWSKPWFAELKEQFAYSMKHVHAYYIQ